MIVNFFLKDKLNPKDIESISNLFLTLISLYTCYMIYFTEEYYTTICVLYGYMVIDLFFTPFHKWDMFIHHFFTISSVQFVLENINVNANYYSTRQLLITETSSIFLGIKYFVNKSNYNMLKIIVNLLFVITFFKLRIYDYTQNIIFSDYFYNSLDVGVGKDLYKNYWVYRNTWGLYAIQLYWGAIIIKIIGKPFFSRLRVSTCEYYLQYSYYLNFLTTVTTYSLVMYSEDKLIYGTFTFLDVVSNMFVLTSSYYFHNNIYVNVLANNENYNIENNQHKQYLIIDIFCIQLRALSNIFVNLNMHHNLKENSYIFKIGIIISSICLLTIDNIYYFHIKYNGKIRGVWLSITELCMSLPPIYGVITSLQNVENFNYHINTYLLCYIIFLSNYIKPFYNGTQLSIHIIMCFVNYQLVLNNYEKLSNMKDIDYIL